MQTVRAVKLPTEVQAVLDGKTQGCLIVGEAIGLLKAMPDACVDFVFTDPPYGHNNNDGDLIENWEKALGRPGKKPAKARPIANDGEEANNLVVDAFFEFTRLLRHGGCCCCCCCCSGGGGPDPQFARWSLWLDAAMGFKQMVIWDKGGLGIGWHYRRNYETLLVGEKPGGKTKWYGGHGVANVVRLNRIIPRADQHPTEKPWPLAAHFLELHSRRGDVVLDPFAGSGPTLVACQRLGRRYIGFELDNKWAAKARVKLARLLVRPAGK